MKYIAMALGSVGLAGIGSFLLLNGHETAGACLIIAAILTIL